MKITTKQVARLLGHDQQTLRVAIQMGLYDFCTMVPTSPKHTVYIYHPAKLAEFFGLPVDELERRLTEA